MLQGVLTKHLVFFWQGRRPGTSKVAQIEEPEGDTVTPLLGTAWRLVITLNCKTVTVQRATMRQRPA